MSLLPITISQIIQKIQKIYSIFNSKSFVYNLSTLRSQFVEIRHPCEKSALKIAIKPNSNNKCQL